MPRNFLFLAKKKSKSEMASAGSILGIGLWANISGRLVDALPFFHSRLVIAGDRKSIGKALHSRKLIG